MSTKRYDGLSRRGFLAGTGAMLATPALAQDLELGEFRGDHAR